MNIYEKILAIMNDVQKLQKDDHVKFGTTSYKALSEEKVTTIMRQQLIKHKLVVFPIQQAANRVGNITHVDVVYRMVNAEDPTDYIEIASAGDGADSHDKGSGKAMTYAFKYMWLRTFALPTGEDPDKISSAELDAKDEAEARAKSVGKGTISEVKAKALEALLSENGISVDTVYKLYNVNSLKELTEVKHENIANNISKLKDYQNGH